MTTTAAALPRRRRRRGLLSLPKDGAQKTVLSDAPLLFLPLFVVVAAAALLASSSKGGATVASAFSPPNAASRRSAAATTAFRLKRCLPSRADDSPAAVCRVNRGVGSDYAPRLNWPLSSSLGAALGETPSDLRPTGGPSKTKREAAVERFLSEVQRSLREGTFASFTVRGAKAPRKRKRGGRNGGEDDAEALQRERDALRGRIRAVQGRLIRLDDKKKKSRGGGGGGGSDDADDGGALYVQATTKYHGTTDAARNWHVGSEDDDNDDDEEVGVGVLVIDELRRLLLPGGAVPSTSNARRGGGGIGPEFTPGEENETDPAEGVRGADLVTTTGGTWELDIASKKPKCRRVKGSRANISAAGAAAESVATQEVLSHDRTKSSLPGTDGGAAPYLVALGVTDEIGQPRRGKGDMPGKLRQIRKFVEVAGGLVDGAVAAAAAATEEELGGEGAGAAVWEIVTTDMGCGRGYLTFALHAYLREKYGGNAFRDGDSSPPPPVAVRTRGVDVRPKLVAQINAVARGLGSDFDGLDFAEGTIEGFLETTASETTETSHGAGGSFDEEKGDNGRRLDVLIALHACDTATDDALWSGIAKSADVIVTAPCCQREVRRQLDPYVQSLPPLDADDKAAGAARHPLADVLRHPIYRERHAEHVTDALRGLLLEYAGYDVRIFEFVGGEHTAKNVMITATKRAKPLGLEEREGLAGRIRNLANMHGVQRQRLAGWMEVSLLEEEIGDLDAAGMGCVEGAVVSNGVADADDGSSLRGGELKSPGRMPPL